MIPPRTRLGTQKHYHCQMIFVCFEQEKAKNTSERCGGKKGVMSGIFDGLPCCMANKVGTHQSAIIVWFVVSVCLTPRKGEKGGEAWTDHLYKPTSYSNPAARPVRCCLIGRLGTSKGAAMSIQFIYDQFFCGLSFGL
jgi:hypothetical protein